MQPASNGSVLAATRQWLKPVVNVLLRCGITWQEFAALAQSTYVEIATRQFGKRGRPTNVSRTAVLTGLTRRQVRKQRERIDAGPAPLTGYVSKASIVLSAWHLDPVFLDGTGKPALLPLEGDGASFASLLRRCGAGDVPSSTLLKELRSAGAVRKTTDGRLEALSRIYIPQAVDGDFIRLWGTGLADLASTYVNNLTRNRKIPPRFERAAVSDRIRPDALPEFRRFLNEEGQAFLERLDAWLTAHEVRAGEPSAQGAVRVGAAVYHIQD
jgi:hypothetical protein